MLSQKLADAVLLGDRTLLAFNSQKDLVDARQEIIENLKKEIETIKRTHLLAKTQDGNSCSDLTSLS